MASILRSKALYFGSAIGIGSAYYLNRRSHALQHDSSPIIEGLSKTERLAGMDWRPPSRHALINRLKGYNETGMVKLEPEEAIFDLLIIGGGATGTGCALDASSRGLKTACLEKGDFSCGTKISKHT